MLPIKVNTVTMVVWCQAFQQSKDLVGALDTLAIADSMSVRRGTFVQARRVCQREARLSTRSACVKAGSVCQGGARMSRRGAFVEAGRVQVQRKGTR